MNTKTQFKVPLEVRVNEETIQTLSAYQKAFQMSGASLDEAVAEQFEKMIDNVFGNGHSETGEEQPVRTEINTAVFADESLSFNIPKDVANKMRALELITGDSSVVIRKLSALAGKIVTEELRNIFAPSVEASAHSTIPQGQYEIKQAQTPNVIIHKGNTETTIPDADIGEGLGDDVEIDYEKEEAEFTPPKQLHQEHEFVKPRATKRTPKSSKIRRAKVAKVSAND